MAWTAVFSIMDDGELEDDGCDDETLDQQESGMLYNIARKEAGRDPPFSMSLLIS